MAARNANIPIPDAKEVRKARQRYDEESGWNLSYRGARDGIERALRGESKFTVGEETIRFLRDWNRRYYLKHSLRKSDIAAVDKIMKKYRSTLEGFRKRSLTDLVPDDDATIVAMFGELRIPLGKTGAAKALFINAPNCFPPWDTQLRKRYHIGADAERYLKFIRIRKRQAESLGKDFPDPVKALDEWDWAEAWL